MQPQYAYQTAPMNMPMMAQGGLPAAARQVQSKGRGDDSVLVHMTPGEVKGLQAIAMANGGSLSINPNTGLPEAGFLKNLLPMIAGVALAPLTAGTSLAFLGTPLGAGLAVGGIEALRTKSLSKGLMAGLGAAGGAGLGSALSTAGQAASSAAATSAIPAEAVKAGVTGPMAPTVTGLDAMKAGVTGLADPAGRAAFMQAAGGPMGLAGTVSRAAAPAIAGSLTPPPAKTEAKGDIRPFSFSMNPQDVDFRTGAPGESTSEIEYLKPKFTPVGVYGVGKEPAYGTYSQGGGVVFDHQDDFQNYATGGLTAFAEGGYKRPKARPLAGPSPYKFAHHRENTSMAASIEENFAAGGLNGVLEDGAFIVPADVVSHLGNGSNEAGQEILAKGLGAKPIRGDGDGMSDSIKTKLEDGKEARVADGEAYIPASVVEKVGAKRLYAMMDKIRRARTGKEEQAPEIEPEEYMPA